jgi:hypothetical protein
MSSPISIPNKEPNKSKKYDLKTNLEIPSINAKNKNLKDGMDKRRLRKLNALNANKDIGKSIDSQITKPSYE